MQQQREMQKIAEWLLQEMKKADDIEKTGVIMKCPMEMAVSSNPVKLCYAIMKDGTEVKFGSVDELVAFIRNEAERKRT